MAVTVPNPPYKTPIADKSGFMSPSWIAWFREVFRRIGGSVALSNEELADLPALELAAVEADITALQSDVTSIQNVNTSQGNSITTLQTLVNDLQQGPNL
jgi:hypothetical protein